MSKKTQTRCSVLAVILFAMTACVSQPRVFSDFDPAHDFSKIKTFAWAQDPPMLREGDYPLSDQAEKRMTNAIKQTLITKGYEFIEDQELADISILYTMGARDKIEVISYPTPYYQHRTDPSWGDYYYPYIVRRSINRGWPYEEEYNKYTDGTIGLDIFDAREKQPIWHTIASKRLTRNERKSDLENANDIANTLLQHFPLQGCQVEVSDQCRPFND